MTASAPKIGHGGSDHSGWGHQQQEHVPNEPQVRPSRTSGFVVAGAARQTSVAGKRDQCQPHHDQKRLQHADAARCPQPPHAITPTRTATRPAKRAAVHRGTLEEQPGVHDRKQQRQRPQRRGATGQATGRTRGMSPRRAPRRCPRPGAAAADPPRENRHGDRESRMPCIDRLRPQPFDGQMRSGPYRLCGNGEERGDEVQRSGVRTDRAGRGQHDQKQQTPMNGHELRNCGSTAARTANTASRSGPA